MSHEDYEKYYSAFVHFVRGPQRFDDFLRDIGSIEDLEKFRDDLQEMLRREERRRWLIDMGTRFFKVLVTVGAGLATLVGAATIVGKLIGFGG